MDARKIGQRLKELRENRGQSKRFVAKTVGIPYRTYCSYEYSERIPNDENKIKLAAHFEQTVESIFFAERYHEKK